MAPCAVAQAEEQAEDTPAANTIAAAQSLADSSNKANHWQVVSGEYQGNAADNKTELGGEGSGVRAQKNVVATDTENEFLIYESIDVKQRFADYFESAEYHATTSNNLHGKDLGTVSSSMTGNQKVQVTGQSGTYSNYGTFNILSSQGELLASDVTLYWSQANNVTFYLKVDDSHYILLGASVRKDSENTVLLSEEAEELIMSKVAQYAGIESVVDEMGPNIEYLETVTCDGLTTPTADARTLTWTPDPKDNPVVEKTRTKESKEVTYTDHNGTVHTETVYRYESWATNVVELVYKVRLTPSVSTGLEQGSNSLPATSASAAENTLTNGTATVTWDKGSGGLASPVVRGMLYELKLAKTDDALPAHALADAAFTLYRDADCTQAVATATSAVDAAGNAVVDFPNLQCGTYYLKETAAPEGYETEKDSDGKAVVRAYTLCYTDVDSPGELVGQNTAETPNEEALVDTTDQPIQNKQIIQFKLKKANTANQETLLAGARYCLYLDDTSDNVDGQRRFTEADKATSLVATTGADGTALFAGLTRNATYWLVEEAAPAGFSVTPKGNSPYVTVDTDSATGKLVVSGTYLSGNSASEQEPVPDITVTDTPLALRVIKTGGSDGAALAGAEFTLYTDEGCTIKATDLYADAGLSAQAAATQATADDGSLTWYGLHAGTYYLKETRAPAGYQLFDQVVRLAVSQDRSVTATMDADGDGSPDTAQLNPDDEAHGLDGVADMVPYISVADDPILQLPTTAGPGTRDLTLAGLALVGLGMCLAAGAWYARKGKRL